jgi:hypothetical protein
MKMVQETPKAGGIATSPEPPAQIRLWPGRYPMKVLRNLDGITHWVPEDPAEMAELVNMNVRREWESWDCPGGKDSNAIFAIVGLRSDP